MTNNTRIVSQRAELKPCPFCGAEAIAYEAFPQFEYPWNMQIEHHQDCPLAPLDQVCYETPDALASAWNTRFEEETLALSRDGERECPHCNGDGDVDNGDHPCMLCGGSGVVRTSTKDLIPESNAGVREAIAADKCGAVSEDAIAHLAIRSPLNRAIYKAVRSYNMSNMADADDHWQPYPLVDLMSNPAPADIGTGEMEMIALVDDIEAAILSLLPASIDVPREAIVEALRPAIWSAANDGTSVQDALELAVDAISRLPRIDVVGKAREEAQRRLAMVRGCLDCNADDARFWVAVIDFLKEMERC